MSANPSWYDLLDIEPTASADEVRAAWKAAIADLDPTDRKFRLLNQAAEVLLDPESRAQYDASLEPAVVEAAPDEVETAEDAEEVEEGAAPVPPPYVPPPSGTGSERVGGKRLPLWVLAALGVVLAALVGLCVWQAQEPTDEQVTEATADAQTAAEKAIVAIVSYDYRSLDDDQARAAAYMTDDFKDDYESLFAVIRENAPETKTIISTEVVGSSIVRSGDDRVQVFLFINTPTLNAKLTEPEVYKNQVTVTMEKDGDEWLVDDLVTTELAD